MRQLKTLIQSLKFREKACIRLLLLQPLNNFPQLILAIVQVRMVEPVKVCFFGKFAEKGLMFSLPVFKGVEAMCYYSLGVKAMCYYSLAGGRALPGTSLCRVYEQRRTKLAVIIFEEILRRCCWLH